MTGLQTTTLWLKHKEGLQARTVASDDLTKSSVVESELHYSQILRFTILKSYMQVAVRTPLGSLLRLHVGGTMFAL